MSDNLRDKIAKTLFDESYLDAPPETIPNEIHPGYHEMAQAIIDEFGLTVETVGGFVSVAGNHDARRVVGKWERCE